MNVATNHNLKCTVALAALYDVYDPEIGLNVVDLGLIYGIHFWEEEKKVQITMTLTTQFCPMGESIVSNVEQALENIFGDHAIQADLTFDPPWSHERISAEGQQFLNR